MDEKSGERKAKKIRSDMKESRGDMEAAVLVVVVASEADLKVDRHLRGEEEEVGEDDRDSGDLCNGIASGHWRVCEALDRLWCPFSSKKNDVSFLFILETMCHFFS